MLHSNLAADEADAEDAPKSSIYMTSNVTAVLFLLLPVGGKCTKIW